MGTVLYCSRVSTNGLRGSKMVAQALNMRKEQDQQLKETSHVSLSLTPKLFLFFGRKEDGATMAGRLCYNMGPRTSVFRERREKRHLLRLGYF
jgi:hypothetical protein